MIEDGGWLERDKPEPDPQDFGEVDLKLQILDLIGSLCIIWIYIRMDCELASLFTLPLCYVNPSLIDATYEEP